MDSRRSNSKSKRSSEDPKSSSRSPSLKDSGRLSNDSPNNLMFNSILQPLEEKIQEEFKEQIYEEERSSAKQKSKNRAEEPSDALVPVYNEAEDPNTFLTQKKDEEKIQEAPWTLNDLLFPGGKVAKLCKILNPRSKDIKLGEILKRSGINESLPVILLSGAEGEQKARLLVGIARAAYSTDAVIVDNGLKSGIEQACSRKKVKLMGICPEELIVYPTKASSGDRLGELSAGHSHLFIVGSKGDGMRWDNTVPLKIDLIERIRKGRGGPGSYICRALCVLVGDNSNCLWEVEKAIKAGWPVLVIEGSSIGREVVGILKGQHSNLAKSFQDAIRNGKIFIFPESGTAEHLASAVHLHLAVTL